MGAGGQRVFSAGGCQAVSLVVGWLQVAEPWRREARPETACVGGSWRRQAVARDTTVKDSVGACDAGDWCRRPAAAAVGLGVGEGRWRVASRGRGERRRPWGQWALGRRRAQPWASEWSEESRSARAVGAAGGGAVGERAPSRAGLLSILAPPALALGPTPAQRAWGVRTEGTQRWGGATSKFTEMGCGLEVGSPGSSATQLCRCVGAFNL